MTVNSRGDRALYQQVADIIRADIASGKLKAGENLPSEAQLSGTLGVGREAIRQALGVLRAEGLIVTERGFGSRVREAQQRRIVKLRRGDTVIARMPSEPERREMDLDQGVPLLVLTRADGSSELLAGDATALNA